MSSIQSPEFFKVSRLVSAAKYLMIAGGIIALGANAVNAAPKDTATCLGSVSANGQRTIFLSETPTPVLIVARYSTLYSDRNPSDVLGEFNIEYQSGNVEKKAGEPFADYGNYMKTIITPTEPFSTTANMNTFNIDNCQIVDAEGNTVVAKGVIARFKAFLAQITSMALGVK